jgi:hypothetical protein
MPKNKHRFKDARNFTAFRAVISIGLEIQTSEILKIPSSAITFVPPLFYLMI